MPFIVICPKQELLDNVFQYWKSDCHMMHSAEMGLDYLTITNVLYALKTNIPNIIVDEWTMKLFERLLFARQSPGCNISGLCYIFLHTIFYLQAALSTEA